MPHWPRTYRSRKLKFHYRLSLSSSQKWSSILWIKSSKPRRANNTQMWEVKMKGHTWKRNSLNWDCQSVNASLNWCNIARRATPMCVVGGSGKTGSPTSCILLMDRCGKCCLVGLLMDSSKVKTRKTPTGYMTNSRSLIFTRRSRVGSADITLQTSSLGLYRVFSTVLSFLQK